MYASDSSLAYIWREIREMRYQGGMIDE